MNIYSIESVQLLFDFDCVKASITILALARGIETQEKKWKKKEKRSLHLLRHNVRQQRP